MEKQTYSDQMIIQYLLDSLPEQETERLDELSFIDDEFAERLDAVETDLVDVYVKGELSDQTLDRFDSYYLTSPKRREKVGFAQALQTVAERAVSTGQVVFENEPPPATVVSANPHSPWTSLLGFFTLQRLTVVAAVVLASLGGWAAFENLRLRGQVDQTQAKYNELAQREKELREKLAQQQRVGSAIEKQLEQVRDKRDRLERELAIEGQLAKLQPVPFTLPAPTRAPGPLTEIRIPPGTDYLLLRLVIEPDDYRRYHIALLTAPGRMPAGWTRGRLRERTIGESQFLDIRIPANLLKPQGYILEVAGISISGVVVDGDKRDYSFKIVKP